MTIVDFLMARVTVDETEARRVLSEFEDSPPSVYDMAQVPMLDAGDPHRVLAECEAKRRIVERHRGEPFADDPTTFFCVVTPSYGWWPCPDLLDLASVYVDHPDFDPAWRA